MRWLYLILAAVSFVAVLLFDTSRCGGENYGLRWPTTVSLVLAGIGSAIRLFSQRPPGLAHSVLFTLFTVGFFFGAADEWFVIHEPTGEALAPYLVEQGYGDQIEFLSRFFRHPDDIIVLGYLLGVMLLVAVFYRTMRRVPDPWFLRLFLTGLFLQLCGVATEIPGMSCVEEYFESGAAVMYAGALWPTRLRVAR